MNKNIRNSKGNKDMRRQKEVIFNVEALQVKVNEIKIIYDRIVECKKTTGNTTLVEKSVMDLLRYQKEDGSFRVIDSYQCDGDFRVEFAYMPTYYATAALMCADSYIQGGLNKREMDCLKKGLHFAIGRQLFGHGFEATKTLIQTLRIYAKAGMYEWINFHAKEAAEFKAVIDRHYTNFVKCIAEEKTCSDWNRDFVDEYKQEIADYERFNPAYVWYAAYGSNISEKRFMKYINSCTDKSAPIKSRNYIFNHNMYFDRASRRWNGAVAFLDMKSEGKAYGKMYLIKKTQLEEIQKMEGSAYSKRELLGFVEDLPVYTFTSEIRRDRSVMPSKEYIETILAGLKEAYNKSEMALEAYLYTRGFLRSEDLQILECIRNSEHAIKVREIRNNTWICKTKVCRSVKELKRCGLIVLDSRSNGVDIEDDNAMVYTCKNKRKLIDVLTALG